jgi:plastocyanin
LAQGDPDARVRPFSHSKELMMRLPLVLALVAAAACGGGGGSDGGIPTIPTTPTNPTATTSVTLQNSLFNPAHILVAPSATVTFTNSDGISHNVIFGNQAIPPISEWTSGTRTAVMPSAAGTYTYTCTLHPGMNGSVKVE